MQEGELMITQDFVTFLSPGTFLSEITTKEIPFWDIDMAIKMVDGVIERYNATPYGFYFTTRGRYDYELDSKETDRSSMYYLGGTVRTLKEIELELDMKNDILIRNMRANGYDKVVINTNSWKIIQPLNNSDIVLDYKVKK
jgi:hypothetical protein